MAGIAGEGDVLGQPQRQLLPARSRQRQVSAREAVREDELDERVGCQRQTHSDGTARGSADISRYTGWHELVFAVLQPANEIDVRVYVGRERAHLQRDADRVRAGARLRRTQQSNVRADAW